MEIEKIKARIDSHMDTVLPITYNILFVNDIACSLIIDSLSALRKEKGLHVYDTKMYAKKIDEARSKYEKKIEARSKYEKKINRVIGDKCSEFFADNNDAFLEEVKKDLDVFYYSIKGVYDAHDIEYSGLLSKLEMAHIILQYSCRMVDIRMSELKKIDSMFNSINLGYTKMSNVLRLFELMLSTLRVKCHIDLNTERCKLAMEILNKDFSDMNKIYGIFGRL